MRFDSFARPETRLVPAKAPVPGAQWQQVWFTARRRAWSSMALVPAHPGASALFIADALAAVGRLQDERPVRLIDAEGVRLPDLAGLLASLAGITARGELAVVAAGCPLDHAASIAIARAADAALLVLPLGHAGFAAARRAVDLVGRDRFLGAVTVALGSDR